MTIDNARKPAETRFEVESRAGKAIEAALLAIGAHNIDAVVIRRIIASAYPQFCGQMHDERANGSPAAVVRVACDIMFANMLYETVCALTPPKDREHTLRDLLKKARSSVLGALGLAKPDSSEPAPLTSGLVDQLHPGADELALVMHRAMTAMHPSGTVGVRAVTGACGSIAATYFAALPEHLRAEEIEQFCMQVRKIVAEEGR